MNVSLTILEREHFQLEQQLKDLDDLEQAKMDGIALMPLEDEQILERIDALWANNIPVVTFNTDTPGSRGGFATWARTII